MNFNEQVKSIVFLLFLVNIIKYTGIDKKENIMYIRLVYILVNVAILAIYRKIADLAREKEDNRPVQYTLAKNPFVSEEPEVKTKTISEYDNLFAKEQMKQIAISMAMLLGLHVYMGISQPLIIQSIMPLKTLIFHPIFRYYILNASEEDLDPRPYSPHVAVRENEECETVEKSEGEEKAPVIEIKESEETTKDK